MRASERARLGDDGDGFAAAINMRDAAKKLAGVDGWIFLGQSIAARGKDNAIALGPFAHNAMHERTAGKEEQNEEEPMQLHRASQSQPPLVAAL